MLAIRLLEDGVTRCVRHAAHVYLHELARLARWPLSNTDSTVPQAGPILFLSQDRIQIGIGLRWLQLSSS